MYLFITCSFESTILAHHAIVRKIAWRAKPAFTRETAYHGGPSSANLSNKPWLLTSSSLPFSYRSSNLRFVLAPSPTVASKTLVPQGTSSNQMEVSPQGGAIVEHMSEAIAKHGGCALIVDYGEDGSNRHTLRVSFPRI